VVTVTAEWGGRIVTKLLGTIGVHIVSIAGIVRFYFSLPENAQHELSWQLFAVAMCVFNFAAILWESISHFRNAPKTFRLTQPDKIRNYMIRWLQSGGRAVVFTRDMTWLNESVREILIRKAQNHELTLCIEHMLPIAKELEKEGADIISYGDLGVVPQSRYTIIDFEKHGARVAVGGAVGRRHVIQEFREGDHPFFAVAADLAKILIAYKQRGHVTQVR
jgi:hypothetical protein